MADRKMLRNFDRLLLSSALLIFVVGISAIFSATQAKGLPFSSSFVIRQASWLVIGFFFLVAAVKISYQKFIDAAYPLYLFNLFLLFLVFVLGSERLGAQRWFSLGPFAFQPSEFIKITMILALANYVGGKKGSMSRPESLIIPSVILAAPFVAVLMQPDLGTALLLVPIYLSILMVSGVRTGHIVAMITSGVAAGPFFWHFLKDYQKQRLLVFMNPNIDPLGAGYTIIQSKIAIGSGGFLGKGWLAGTQNQLNFLPERHTDFIFSVIGEEWGFVGACVIVLLYFIIVKRGLYIASMTTDMYGKAIATGLSVMLALQAVINIGMTIGLMPVVGIPLPLVSYGGSSLLATLVAVGLLLNIGMRRSTF